MLGDLLTALALMMVLEGIMPFLNPARFRRTLITAARLDDRGLRVAGLVCMLGGVALLYVVH
ncbi:MAG: DUF2065 domain-containing protein [Gammaproteobacteria bacterium]|nr:DUF2065 domain-containing protein [Gammaproteobacteria bacterium]MCP5199033.1 DUF2065 domain-containing protein [Gammaproteobacteria bacterium]